MAELILNRHHTRFRAIKVRDNAVSFGTAGFNLTLQSAPLTASRVITIAAGADFTIPRITHGSLNFEADSVGTNSISTSTFALTGAVVTDRIFIEKVNAGTAGALPISWFVSAADTVSVVMANVTAVAAGTTSVDIDYLFISP
jgi:hypothetical protein